MPTTNKDDGEVYNFTAQSTKNKDEKTKQRTTPPSFHTNRLCIHGQYMFIQYMFAYAECVYVYVCMTGVNPLRTWVWVTTFIPNMATTATTSLRDKQIHSYF